MSDHQDVEILAPTPGERIRKIFKSKDVKITFYLFLAITAFFVFLGLWYYPKFMPEVMSEQMQKGKNVIVYFTVMSAPIAGVVISIAIYTFFQRHKGDTPPPDGPPTRTNTPIIAVWTVVTSLFCIVAIVWGLTEMNVNSSKAEIGARSALVVEVTGSQWVWTFNYPDLGIETDRLNLPVDRPVIFKVTSSDVNHSFWPVQLGIKVDANRMVTTLARTTPDKLGTIVVKCAELCGLYHAYMETQGNVMTTEDFKTWVTAQGGHNG